MNKEKLLGVGFGLSLVPEVLYECGKDALNWLADRVVDRLVQIDDNIQELPDE